MTIQQWLDVNDIYFERPFSALAHGYSFDDIRDEYRRIFGEGWRDYYWADFDAFQAGRA